jgi:septal ring factor EnvC (AmiA/AmiB activator)
MKLTLLFVSFFVAGGQCTACQQLQDQLEIAQVALSSAGDEANALREELAVSNAQVASLQAQLAAAQAEIEQLRKRI